MKDFRCFMSASIPILILVLKMEISSYKIEKRGLLLDKRSTEVQTLFYGGF